MKKDKKLLFWQVTILVAILLSTVTTVVLASFQAGRTNASTLTFRDNVTITIGGVTKTSNNYYWNYKKESAVSTYTAGTASINVVDYLELAPITVTVNTGATCYIRLFACVGTTLPSSTIALGTFPNSITAQSGSTAATIVNSSNYTSAETSFAFSSTTNQTAKFVSLCTATANSTTFTMSSAYIPYDATSQSNDYPNSSVSSKKFYLYLSVSASTDNASWDTFVLTPTS